MTCGSATSSEMRRTESFSSESRLFEETVAETASPEHEDARAGEGLRPFGPGLFAESAVQRRIELVPARDPLFVGVEIFTAAQVFEAQHPQEGVPLLVGDQHGDELAV